MTHLTLCIATARQMGENCADVLHIFSFESLRFKAVDTDISYLQFYNKISPDI